MIHIDADELRVLELDLRKAPGRLQRASRTSLRTRIGPLLADVMRRDATGHQGNYFGKPGTEYDTPLERHVSHEMVAADTVEAGIEMKGAGKLAHIIAKGSVNTAPAYDYRAGPRNAMPRIAQILGDDAENAVLGTES
jgi:hypothetical protein